MGTWGIKTFENDGASDWVYDLEESNDLSVIENALTSDDEDYLDSCEAEEILPACEVILGLLGKERNGLPKKVKEWIQDHNHLDPSPLLPKAISSCERILGENSEMRELWEENEEEYENWRKDVLELLEKLKG